MMNCKKKLIALTMASVMIAALTGCGASGQESTATANNTSAAGESNPGGEDGVFTIAYAPNESNTEAADARNGLADDLSAVLGCEVEELSLIHI